MGITKYKSGYVFRIYIGHLLICARLCGTPTWTRTLPSPHFFLWR